MISMVESVMTGRGLYTVSEAALYARMSSQTAHAWFWPSKRSSRLREAIIVDDDSRYLTFAEFAEAVAIRFLRHHYKVSLQGVRDAIDYVKENHPNIEFPLTQQRSKIRVYQKQLYIYMDGDDINPVQISGRSIGQKHFTECFMGYLKDFSFNAAGLVDNYLAFRHKDQSIIMNPHRNMGTPMVEGTGFSAQTLHSAVIQEGSIERAARAYEVTTEAIEAAFNYWDELAEAA
jgi:uncharacterized protein (DUF433 family)